MSRTISTTVDMSTGQGLKGKQPLAELQKELPITKPTFIINSQQLRQHFDQLFLLQQQQQQQQQQSSNTDMSDTISSQQPTTFPPLPALSSFQFYTLEHPVYQGVFTKYILIGTDLFEVLTISPTSVKDTPHVRNCKFIDNYIESNATYYLGAPIDLLFHLLPFLLKKFHFMQGEQINAPFLELDEIFCSKSTTTTTNSTTTTSTTTTTTTTSITSTTTPEALQSTTQPSNFEELYNQLFHTSTITQKQSLYKRLQKYCDMSTTQINSETRHHFRLNYTKLNAILSHKLEKVCAQITATPSLQSLSIRPNPKVDAAPSSSPLDQIVQLNDTTMHSYALPREHFQGTFKAWDETCSIIFANALRYLSEYLSPAYFNTFAKLYQNHNGTPYQLDMINDMLNAKSTVVKKSSTASFRIDSDDENHDTSNDQSKTPTKRKDIGAQTNVTKKSKVTDKTPPKGQPSILGFLCKKK